MFYYILIGYFIFIIFLSLFFIYFNRNLDINNFNYIEGIKNRNNYIIIERFNPKSEYEEKIKKKTKENAELIINLQIENKKNDDLNNSKNYLNNILLELKKIIKDDKKLI